MFVGPTIATSTKARALARPFNLRRPVRRHDIERLVDAHGAREPPGIIAIVDGVFHDTLAVGHAEIRDAMRRGWIVWGLSSMGAIRAREMAHVGMRGFGDVFERFRATDDFRDDEVALLHERAAPYRPVSEPLIHLRAAIAHLVSEKIVDGSDAHAVVSELESLWYGERTLRGTIRALAQRAPRAAARIQDELREVDRFRTKTKDLERFLEQRPFGPIAKGTPV